ncbi:NADP-dependent oxidoreductase, partial [Escherichia coli]|nr:NADP-dependent oxidoreductase [Escherichia coli]
MSNGTRERKLKVKRGAKKMERLGITGYGPAIEVFKRITAEPRELTANHIRVKMKAFGINPYDIALRSGSMQEVRKLTFPYVLGNDGAGIVTEVAADVQSFKVGDRVAVHPISGAYGEEIVLPVGKAAKIPEKMSWSEAAAIVTPGITAYNLINHLLDLQPTDTVMIEGASGAVGTSLIQLLHIRGIRTLASASKKNEEKIRQLGVSDFSAYDQEDPGIKFQNQADTVIDATKGSVKGESGIQIMK